MNGKDFEKICIARMEKEEEAGRATMGRYGVQGTFIGDKPIDVEPYMERLMPVNREGRLAILAELVQAARSTAGGWQKMESLPDFEGIIASRGQQFTFDAKVCNQASFPLDKELKSFSRQHRHLRKRSKFGGIGFYLIHFPERVMTKKTDPEQTWAFPVSDDHPFWQAFDRGEVKRISRLECEQYGVLVEWNTIGNGRTLRPDILEAIFKLAEGAHFKPARPAVTALAAKPF